MVSLNLWLVFSLAAATLVDISAPILLGVFLARRYQSRWRYWFYGLLVFLLFQGISRVPAMLFLQSRPAVKEALKEPLLLWLFLFFAAASAGLFEEGGRWLAFRYAIPSRERKWSTALMLGAGHGGLEAIAIGLVVLLSLAGYLVVMLLPSEMLSSYAAQIKEARQQFAQMQGWEPLLGGWERLGALAIQVGLTVMVLQAFLQGGRWWWYALGAHTLVDFTTVGFMQWASKAWGQTTAMVAVEGLVAIYALLAFWFILSMQPRQEEPGQEPIQEN